MGSRTACHGRRDAGRLQTAYELTVGTRHDDVVAGASLGGGERGGREGAAAVGRLDHVENAHSRTIGLRHGRVQPNERRLCATAAVVKDEHRDAKRS